MSKTPINPKLFARRESRMNGARRWQALQAQLSAALASDASNWKRRSFANCIERVLPSDVSTAANASA